VARGSNVMRGYWNNERETAAAFRNAFFRTGDIGYQDRDEFSYLLDRQKDMIVTGGGNFIAVRLKPLFSTNQPCGRWQFSVCQIRSEEK
jgi:long-subunit acyl-CoA synthetase (AMP-forming)